MGRVSHRVAMSVCDDKIFQKRLDPFFFSRFFKREVLDQPTVDSGGVSRAVAVCTSTALQWHFLGTSTAFPRHFHGTSMAKKEENKYCCFYPHRLRESVPFVCRIFL